MIFEKTQTKVTILCWVWIITKISHVSLDRTAKRERLTTTIQTKFRFCLNIICESVSHRLNGDKQIT